MLNSKTKKILKNEYKQITDSSKNKEKKEYIFPLAMQIKENLTNDDIQTCISVLNKEEKEILKKRLLEMKIEVKTPDDFKINRTIYLTIATIMDKACINQIREKNILNSNKN